MLYRVGLSCRNGRAARAAALGLALSLGAALLSGVAAAPAAPHADIEAARILAGRDPDAARRALRAIREQAQQRGQLAHRLAADEAECRVLTDIDPALARATAEAGSAAAAAVAEPGPEVQRAALRLAACGAGALLDMGRTAAGNAELDRLVGQTAGHPALAAAEALARLERGLHRSRRGELVPGQVDLLAACAAFEALALPRDLELCHGHLANHYKRTGDADEAIRLLETLLQGARARGASADAAIYLYSLAQVRHERGEWARALAGFDESRQLAKAAGDRIGEAYAEHATGHALLRLHRPAEALPHAQRALGLIADGTDPLQTTRATLLRAMLFNELGHGAEALRDLTSRQAAMEEAHDDLLRADWLLARSRAEALLGRWRQAYGSAEAARQVQARLQEQRLSEQSARLRMQFNREKDTAELSALRRVNEQGAELRRMQAIAVGLFAALFGVALWFAARKLTQARRLHRLALVDELTGLPNRRAVLARLDEQLRLARRPRRALSVLMVDVDHFKAVNDTHGHAVGDAVLRHMAGLLAGCLRSGDSVGRLGGEEFLVVLPDAPLEHACAVAERMRQTVADMPFAGAGAPLPLTVSIGVACLGEAREAADGLVERADRALYAAKRSGRNLVATSVEQREDAQPDTLGEAAGPQRAHRHAHGPAVAHVERPLVQRTLDLEPVEEAVGQADAT